MHWVLILSGASSHVAVVPQQYMACKPVVDHSVGYKIRELCACIAKPFHCHFKHISGSRFGNLFSLDPRPRALFLEPSFCNPYFFLSLLIDAV